MHQNSLPAVNTFVYNADIFKLVTATRSHEVMYKTRLGDVFGPVRSVGRCRAVLCLMAIDVAFINSHRAQPGIHKVIYQRSLRTLGCRSCLLHGFLDTHLLIHSWCDIARNRVGIRHRYCKMKMKMSTTLASRVGCCKMGTN